MASPLVLVVRGFNRVAVRLREGPRKRRVAVGVCFERFIGPRVRDVAADYAPKDEGALETSIEFEVRGTVLVIGVPSNSPAGPYARRMHEDNYIAGPGTVAKGEQAGRLYISRAINDQLPKIRLLLADCIIKVS